MFSLTKKNDYLSEILNKELQYINSTMSVINEYTDDIYEAMADHDCEQLVSKADDLIQLLKDLKDSYKEED